MHAQWRIDWMADQRNLVMTTVGLLPAMRKVTQEGLQITLALSLHAPDDELRNTLVPVNARLPIREVLEVRSATSTRPAAGS